MSILYSLLFLFFLYLMNTFFSRFQIFFKKQPDFSVVIIESLLIHYFGDEGTAKIELAKIASDDDKVNDLFIQINNHYPTDKLISLFSELYDNKERTLMQKILNPFFSYSLTSYEISQINDLLKLIDSRIKNDTTIVYPSLSFSNFFNTTVKLSIKNIREEVGLNKRTFNKWLSYFFKDKYSFKRSVTIVEYFEIMKIFYLRHDEPDFDFENKIDIYRKRYKDGLLYSKYRLKKYTNDDYKSLKEELNYINKKYNTSIPLDVDIYPLLLISLFLDENKEDDEF